MTKDKLDPANNTQEEDIEEKEFDELIARRERVWFPEDKLDAIFRKQKELDDRILENNDRFPKELGDQISYLCIAIIHEAVELQRLTNWKWWKQPIQFDLYKAQEELVDIQHFVTSAAIKLKLTSTKYFETYSSKCDENHKRQEQGY